MRAGAGGECRPGQLLRPALFDAGGTAGRRLLRERAFFHQYPGLSRYAAGFYRGAAAWANSLAAPAIAVVAAVLAAPAALIVAAPARRSLFPSDLIFPSLFGR